MKTKHTTAAQAEQVAAAAPTADQFPEIAEANAAQTRLAEVEGKQKKLEARRLELGNEDDTIQAQIKELRLKRVTGDTGVTPAIVALERRRVEIADERQDVAVALEQVEQEVEAASAKATEASERARQAERSREVERRERAVAEAIPAFHDAFANACWRLADLGVRLDALGELDVAAASRIAVKLVDLNPLYELVQRQGWELKTEGRCAQIRLLVQPCSPPGGVGK
ncbi:MAG TPA: hypothetical protein VES66_08050 [Terriglobales bacterium]|nr:hypothetical protein [Terriglobales bacterium]